MDQSLVEQCCIQGRVMGKCRKRRANFLNIANVAHTTVICSYREPVLVKATDFK